MVVAMRVILVVERPRDLGQAVAPVIQGDFAVRTFASPRSFYRLVSSRTALPDLLLVRMEDFHDELIEFDQICRLRFASLSILYLGDEKMLALHQQLHIYSGSLTNLSFYIQENFGSTYRSPQ